jgi:hypothetical protein
VIDNVVAKHGAPHDRLYGDLATARAVADWSKKQKDTARTREGYDKARKDHEADLKSIEAAQKAYDAHLGDARRDLMAEAGGGGKVAMTEVGKPTRAERERNRDAAEFVGALSNGELAVNVKGGGTRAEYTKIDNTVKVSKGTGRSVVVHEMAHALEERPAVKAAAADFWRSRVGNEDPTPMNKVLPGAGYGKDEHGRKDDFHKAFGEPDAYYVGKVYSGLHPSSKDPGKIFGTEIMSMGLQKLYENPVRFMRADPEYARFVLAAAGGRL